MQSFMQVVQESFSQGAVWWPAREEAGPMQNGERGVIRRHLLVATSRHRLRVFDQKVDTQPNDNQAYYAGANEGKLLSG